MDTSFIARCEVAVIVQCWLAVARVINRAGTVGLAITLSREPAMSRPFVTTANLSAFVSQA